MPELWRNQDCVFEGGCNRAEAVSCGCPQCQSARTICDSPFHLSHCDWFTRKQPDRGTVDYPANWSRPARQPCSLSHMRVSKRQHRLLIDLIPHQQSIFFVWVCRHVGCVGFLREFLWRPLPERVLERGYTAYTPTHPRKFCSVSIEEAWELTEGLGKRLVEARSDLFDGTIRQITDRF